jgi:hypothetical protein
MSTSNPGIIATAPGAAGAIAALGIFRFGRRVHSVFIQSKSRLSHFLSSTPR